VVEKFLRHCELVFGKYWVVIIGVVFLWLITCWSIGYYGKALYGKNFELASVWTGIAAIVAVGAIGIGRSILEYKRYRTDSALNSNQGEKPQS